MNYTREEALIYDALSSVETPPFDITAGITYAAKQAHKPLRISPPRRTLALAAVCIILVLAVGAAAVVGVSGLWREFLGDTVPGYAISTVNVSQTAGDYILTVEDAMVDSRSVLLLLSLRRVDGGSIDPEAHLSTNSMHAKLTVDGEKFNGAASGFQDEKISEDGKSITYLYEMTAFDDQAELIGKQLTFTADGVAVQLREPDGYYQILGDAPVSLAPLAGIDVPDLSDLQLRDKEADAILAQAIAPIMEQVSIPLPMAEFPQFQVRGGVITERGLSIIISGIGSTNGDLVCTSVDAVALVDTRDAARYPFYSGSSIHMPDGTYAFLPSFRDCPLSPEDLPYCELEVSYAIDRILSTVPFSLSFPAQDTGSALLIPLEDTTLTVDGVNLHPDELRLSPLGLSMHFLDSMDTIDILYTTGAAPVLHLRDGSSIQTRWNGGYDGHDGVCSVGFGAEDENGARIFFDVTQIISITFGALEISIPS